MRSWLLVLVLLPTSMLAQPSPLYDYLRPTADADLPVATAPCSSPGSNQSSSSMSAVYSGKSGVGPTGASADLSSFYSGGTHWSGRQFSVWQTPLHAYSSLTISITVTQSGVTEGCYSTNNGATWTSFGNLNVGGTETTLTATITGATVSDVLVDVVSIATTIGLKQTTVYDMWLTGGYYAPSGFPGIIRSSLDYPPGPCWIDERSRRKEMRA